VDLTWVCALGNGAFVIILTLAALVNFLSQSPWERFLLAPTAVILAGLSLIVAIKGTDTVNTSSAEVEARALERHLDRERAKIDTEIAARQIR
jgi:cell division protein FtsW (lipid II flippase)